MIQTKKILKKNNKGFTLVELIVVILIIGILSVAIAPQVMKWVGKAGESATSNEIATIKSAVSVAVSEYQSEGHSITADTFTISGSAIGDSDYKSKLDEILVEKPAKNTYEVTVATSGAVTVKEKK